MEKFNSTPDLDQQELLNAMLKTVQFNRKEMQRASAKIRAKLKAQRTK